MRYKFLVLAGIWIRVVLFVTTVLACVTLSLWQFGEVWVNQFDDYLVGTYQKYYQGRRLKAVAELSRDPVESVVLLEELLEDLNEVGKRDRLMRLKRATIESLVQALEAQGKKDKALALVERWVALDILDLFAQLQLTKQLYSTPGREDEGRALLESLYKEVPESSPIAAEYAERLFDEGDIVTAFLVASRGYAAQDSLKGQVWQVFWDTGKDFNGRQRNDVIPEIDDSGLLSLAIKVPAGIKRLRIDPPTASRIVLLNPNLIWADMSEENTLNLWELPIGLVGMERRGAVLTTSGGDDPYFYWAMPSESMGTGAFSGKFIASVGEAYPEIMERIKALPESETLSDRLRELDEYEAMGLLQMIGKRQQLLKLTALVGATLDIFWKGPGENYTGERTVRVGLKGRLEDDLFRFEVDVPLDKEFDKLRIDFPDILGAEFTLESLEILSPIGLKKIVLADVSLDHKHMVARDGALFRVTGLDPYFSVALPGGNQTVSSVLIRGVAR